MQRRRIPRIARRRRHDFPFTEIICSPAACPTIGTIDPSAAYVTTGLTAAREYTKTLVPLAHQSYLCATVDAQLPGRFIP